MVICDAVRAWLERERAERDRRRAEVEAAKRGADLAAAADARAAVEGLQAETPGTVSDAAMRASHLYMNPRVPRTVKQCITIAASERLVAWQGIQAFLAAVRAGLHLTPPMMATYLPVPDARPC